MTCGELQTDTSRLLGSRRCCGRYRSTRQGGTDDRLTGCNHKRLINRRTCPELTATTLSIGVGRAATIPRSGRTIRTASFTFWRHFWCRSSRSASSRSWNRRRLFGAEVRRAGCRIDGRRYRRRSDRGNTPPLRGSWVSRHVPRSACRGHRSSCRIFRCGDCQSGLALLRHGSGHR
jgi:hypothetical protein